MNRFEARKLHMLLMAAVLAGGVPLQAVANEQATLCHASEITFFNCTIRASKKLVSLCGSDNETKPWLQYRMGRPGKILDLVVPSRVDDPDMRSIFFYDLPSATRDGSYSEVGIWFRHADAYYELVTSQDHMYQEGKDDRSMLLVWAGMDLNKAPRVIECLGTSSSDLLIQAGHLVEVMAPKWHNWGISPGDWIFLEGREAHDRAAAKANSGTAQPIIPSNPSQQAAPAR